MEVRELQLPNRDNRCCGLASSRARALGPYAQLFLKFQDEATGDRDWVAQELDLGAPVPLANRVMPSFTNCDLEGELGEVPVDHVRRRRCRWWPGTNGLSVEAISPSDGGDLVEGTLNGLRRRVAVLTGCCVGAPGLTTPRMVFDL
jgi:hypothetical protein